MAVAIPTRIPDALTAGDTWRWTAAFGDYPASAGWTLTYYLRGVGSVDVVATPDGDGYSVTKAASATESLVAGTYQYLARVANAGGEVYTVDSGAVVVLANAATAAAGALEPSAEVILPLIDAEIKARLSGTAGSAHDSYQIDGRAITKIPLADLYALRTKYRLEVQAQQNGGRLPPYRAVFSRA